MHQKILRVTLLLVAEKLVSCEYSPMLFEPFRFRLKIDISLKDDLWLNRAFLIRTEIINDQLKGTFVCQYWRYGHFPILYTLITDALGDESTPV